MKASEVIAALRKLCEEHGDLPVFVEDGIQDSSKSEALIVKEKSINYPWLPKGTRAFTIES